MKDIIVQYGQLNMDAEFTAQIPFEKLALHRFMLPVLTLTPDFERALRPKIGIEGKVALKAEGVSILL